MGLFSGSDDEDDNSARDDGGGLGELFGKGNTDDGESSREEDEKSLQEGWVEDRDDRLNVHLGSAVEYPENDQTAEELVQHGKGDIKLKYLTDTSGRVIPWLDRPIIDYLRPDEQPEFIYADTRSDLEYEFPDGSSGTIGYAGGAQFLVITDQRILYVNGPGEPGGGELEDEVLIWKYDSIQQVGGKGGWLSDGIGFIDEDGGEFRFKVSGNTDVDDAIGYVDEKITGSREIDPEIQRLVERSEGETVTYETLTDSPILTALDNDEQPHHILEGNALLIDGGDDIETKGGAGRSVITVLTDKRIFCTVESGGSISIPYDSITSIEYGLPPEDEWEVNIPMVAQFSGRTEKLIIHTQGRVYYIDLNERMGILPERVIQEEGRDVSELAHDAMNYVRQQRQAAKEHSEQADSEASETDPLDQIERLKELKDQGAITEEEFQETKEDLLDQI